MHPATTKPSGVGPIDDAWGGLARPGAYLLVGSAAQGRLDLSSRIVGAGAAGTDRTLLFSPREPAAILSVARQAGADLAAAGDRVQLKGVPLGAQLAALGEDGLAKMLKGLAEAADGAGLVVVEDFTPFVRFRSFDVFGAAFRRLVEEIEGHGSTLVLGLGEPANDGSRRLLDFVQDVVTGTVRLGDGGRTLHLIPGTGHAGLSVECDWSRAAHAAPPPAPPPPDMPDEYGDHGSDGYGGTDAAAIDAGAVVVSAVPAEPFGRPPAAPAPLPMPSDAPAEARGDGQGWATIQPVEAPPVGPAETYGVDPLAGGILLDSNHAGSAAPLAPPRAAPPEPATPQPAAPAELISEVEFVRTDPEAGFALDLDEAFASGEPFLVMALRIDGASPHFGTFPTVADGLLGSLAGRDRALVHDDDARLVVLLPGAAPDATERLLSAVRAHLDATVGPLASDAFASVGVLVLPNGSPFSDAAGLLAYALG